MTREGRKLLVPPVWGSDAAPAMDQPVAASIDSPTI
jgi:hypothetical protein